MYRWAHKGESSHHKNPPSRTCLICTNRSIDSQPPSIHTSGVSTRDERERERERATGRGTKIACIPWTLQSKPTYLGPRPRASAMASKEEAYGRGVKPDSSPTKKSSPAEASCGWFSLYERLDAGLLSSSMRGGVDSASRGPHRLASESDSQAATQ